MEKGKEKAVLPEVKEVCRAESEEEANTKLQEGWRLLYIAHAGRGKVAYILGKL